MSGYFLQVIEEGPQCWDLHFGRPVEREEVTEVFAALAQYFCDCTAATAEQGAQMLEAAAWNLRRGYVTRRTTQ